MCDNLADHWATIKTNNFYHKIQFKTWVKAGRSKANLTEKNDFYMTKCQKVLTKSGQEGKKIKILFSESFLCFYVVPITIDDLVNWQGFRCNITCIIMQVYVKNWALSHVRYYITKVYL